MGDGLLGALGAGDRQTPGQVQKAVKPVYRTCFASPHLLVLLSFPSARHPRIFCPQSLPAVQGAQPCPRSGIQREGGWNRPSTAGKQGLLPRVKVHVAALTRCSQEGVSVDSRGRHLCSEDGFPVPSKEFTGLTKPYWPHPPLHP